MKYVLLLPFLMTLFILDRVFLVLVFWKTGYNFNKWVYKDELIIESIHRVLIGLCLLTLIEYAIAIW